MIKKIKYKGLWFYGLSGSGKTYISKKISNITIDVIIRYVVKIKSNDFFFFKIKHKANIKIIL
jgi:SpoVK/Ycf46/Vps4 family AAA+-type ATPase